MKTLKIMLLLVIVTAAGLLSGCNCPANQTSREPSVIYHQRADGLRIPTYGY